MMGASWPHNVSKEALDTCPVPLGEFYDFYCKESERNYGRIHAVKPHLLSSFLYNLATCPEIINHVRQKIGNNINIWSSALFSKPANSKKFVGLHQDKPYWQLSSDNVVTVWIALTASNKENGCLKFQQIKGNTHAVLDVEDSSEAYNKKIKTSHPNDLISFNQILPNACDKELYEYVELKAGEYSMHDVLTFHSSEPNHSNEPRIGFAVRYIDSDTYHLRNSKQDSASHVCGEPSRYMEIEIPPKGELTEESLINYSKYIKSAGLFGGKSY